MFESKVAIRDDDVVLSGFSVSVSKLKKKKASDVARRGRRMARTLMFPRS